MVIALRPSAGTKVYASEAAPLTIDAAGFTALTWTEVKGFDQVGEIGESDEVGNFDSLTEGRIKYRSISDPGQMDAAPADLPADPGQIILKAAKDAAKGGVGEVISFKVEDEAGYGTYARVMVSKWTRQYGGATDVQLRNVTMPIVAGTIVEYSPS
jgi:hypothetical protein